jgi:hypothetical protein
MLVSIGATEDTAWRRSAAAGSDGFIAGRSTEVNYSPPSSSPKDTDANSSFVVGLGT